MDELITALLTLSRLTRAEMKISTIDFSNLIDEVAVEAAPGVAVNVQPDLKVRGDAAMLRVAIDNLIRNAAKFTAKQADPKIWVGRTDYAFFVRDNGVGFNPEYKGKLFRPFERLHSARDYPGTGIGLATVQRIIARHGGRVWAESEPDNGATFWFTLAP
jgi:signal transduction histidine kinase